MYHRELSEQAIISGFRKGDANIIREYFYVISPKISVYVSSRAV